MSPETCPIGQRPSPPYFWGAYPERVLTPDPFATPGWISHCDALASNIGLSGDTAPAGGVKAFVKRLMYGHADFGRHLMPALRLIAASPNYASGGTVRVLDIGGGFGDNYHLLSEARPLLGAALDMRRVDYHVVDNERSCKVGQKLFSARNLRPSFFTSIPNQIYDIVLVIGTLQYVDDFADLCRTAMDRCPAGSIYIARTPITDGSTFYTQQAVCPAFGEEALCKVGTTYVAIVGKQELLEAMNERPLMVDALHSDYSPQLARLPDGHNHASYRAMVWGPTVGPSSA